MHHDHNPAIALKHVPWNKGRLTGQKRPLKPTDVWARAQTYLLAHADELIK
jgi:hypothetical protein